MARVGNSIEKFTSGEIRHINSTLLIVNPSKSDAKSASLFPKINTYANQDWKGFPIIIIERAIFYGGFHRDIGSGGYFSGKDNIPNFKPELMFDIAKWLKEKWQYTEAKTSTWGEQSLESMVGKTLEINARRATLRDGDKTINHSNTEYFDVNGNLIKIATKKYTNEGVISNI